MIEKTVEVEAEPRNYLAVLLNRVLGHEAERRRKELQAQIRSEGSARALYNRD
jgi:hypothetical protein